jgi:IPT/TIG domain-containing protein
MIKLFNTRQSALICFILSIGVLTACTKNDATVDSGKIQLLSFGPTGAKHGDTLRFIGINLNKVTSIQFTGGTAAVVEQKDFKQQTSDLILLIVPQAAEKGFVTLKTPDGDIVTKTQLNLNVTTTVTTITGQARPGDNITINGNFLNWVTKVTFARDKVVQTFISKSINQLVVKVPDDAETGPLILTYGGTDSADLQTKDTLKVTLPVATSISPNPILHQTNLTITGTNLDLAKQILFTGVSSPVTTFVSQSATQLVVKIPAGTQKGKITLVVASGVTTIFNVDLDVVLPAISSMAPNPIDTGANLTITGTNLDLVTSISFVGAANPVTSFVSKTATQIVVKVPGGVLKGKLTFGILNSTLTVQSPVDLQITGGLPPLADFPFAIYTDALQNTFQDWSYSDTHDFNSTANVRQGTKSVRAVYAAGGYQGVTFHAGTGASTAAYTKLEFSIFGEAGTAGKKLNVVVNGNYSTPPQVTIVGGEWTTYSLLLSSLGSPATINEIVLQTAGWGGVVHIDHVGLR